MIIHDFGDGVRKLFVRILQIAPFELGVVEEIVLCKSPLLQDALVAYPPACLIAVAKFVEKLSLDLLLLLLVARWAKTHNVSKLPSPVEMWPPRGAFRAAAHVSRIAATFFAHIDTAFAARERLGVIALQVP
jgi:hypothetical protein